MNSDNTTYSPGMDWQILGELELQVNATKEDILYTWLTELLHSLHLQENLLDKIIVSAGDAIARALHTETKVNFEHIHLTVFIPSVWGAKGQAWGFFRLEKFKSARENKKGGIHIIEFYLYGEGE